MARETRTRSGRVAKYGMCVNEECEMYKVTQTITHGDFVCEKCQKPLTSCPPPTEKNGKGKLIVIIAAAVALLVIIGIFLFTGGKPKVEKLTLDKTQLTLKVGLTDQLNVTVEPEDAQPQLFWQSSNDSVVSVANGIVTALKAGKAQVKVWVMDDDKVSAVCEYTIIEEDVDMQTLDIVEDPLVLRPGGFQQLTANCTPENQNEKILWSSSDESVVKVSPRGKVEAVGIGEAMIIAKSERTDIADTAKVSVEGPLENEGNDAAASQQSASTPVPSASPKPTSAPKPAPASKPAASGGSKNLGYATFKGSWPNDVNGRMVFNSSHVIDSKDPKKRVAEAGDYVIGEWADGHLVQGIWYGADNQVKSSIIIGR